MKSSKHNLTPKDIQDALDGKLSAERKEELDEYALEALRGIEYINSPGDIREMSESSYKKFQKLRKKRKNFGLATLVKAAILLIGLFFVGNLFLGGKKQKNYVADYAAEVPCAHPLCDTRATPITGIKQYNPLLKKAFKQFQDGNYGNASTFFAQYLNVNKNAPTITFYYGIALMKSEKPEKAIHAFESLLYPTPRIFPPQQDYANWYLSLCYLDTQQEQKAIPLLVELAKSKNDFKSDARQLLYDLDYYKL